MSQFMWSTSQLRWSKDSTYPEKMPGDKIVIRKCPQRKAHQDSSDFRIDGMFRIAIYKLGDEAPRSLFTKT